MENTENTWNKTLQHPSKHGKHKQNKHNLGLVGRGWTHRISRHQYRFNESNNRSRLHTQTPPKKQIQQRRDYLCLLRNEGMKINMLFQNHICNVAFLD